MPPSDNYPVVRIRCVFTVFNGPEGYNLFNDSNGNWENMMCTDSSDSSDSADSVDSVGDDAFNDFFNDDHLVG